VADRVRWRNLLPIVLQRGNTTELDHHPNLNPSPFCMEWKQIVYFCWRSDMVVFPGNPYCNCMGTKLCSDIEYRNPHYNNCVSCMGTHVIIANILVREPVAKIYLCSTEN